MNKYIKSERIGWLVHLDMLDCEIIGYVTHKYLISRVGKSYRVEWRIYSWHRVRTKERVMQPKVTLAYQIFWNGGVAQWIRAIAF